jgi:hypothetical protein
MPPNCDLDLLAFERPQAHFDRNVGLKLEDCHLLALLMAAAVADAARIALFMRTFGLELPVLVEQAQSGAHGFDSHYLPPTY